MLNLCDSDYRPLAEKAVKSIARKLYADFFQEDHLDDLVSDVVLRMWSYRDRYDGDRGSVSTWVGTIARNVVIDAHGSELRRRCLFSSRPLDERTNKDGDVLGYVPMAGDRTDDRIIALDAERAFRGAVSSEREGRLLDGLIHGYDAAALAEAEGIKPSMVHTAVCRLRKRLRSAA